MRANSSDSFFIDRMIVRAKKADVRSRREAGDQRGYEEANTKRSQRLGGRNVDAQRLRKQGAAKEKNEGEE